jgi:D-methionine transport system substrate-binding protein
MTESLDRDPLSPHEPNEHEHVLDSLFSPEVQKLVLVVYALLLLAAGGWILFSSEPQAEPLTRAELRVGVVDGPEAEVLELVKKRHPELGLELVRYERPELINPALASGELHAASFQDAVSFEAERARKGLPLSGAALTVTLPLGFYSKVIRHLEDLDRRSKVVLSNEPNAQARALLVLYHYGLVGFARDPAPDFRIEEISKNPRELVFEVAPRSGLALALDDAALVALEYSDATLAKLSPARHALALEDSHSPFASVLVVRTRDREERAPWLDGLLSAYREREVKEFILQNFADSVRRPW